MTRLQSTRFKNVQVDNAPTMMVGSVYNIHARIYMVFTDNILGILTHNRIGDEYRNRI